MFEALDIAASGISAADAFLASAGSGGNTVLQEIPGAPGQGVQVLRKAVVTPPTLPPLPGDSYSGGAQVDAATQAADLSEAKILYAANAQVLNTQESLFGSLIDILDTQANQPPA